MTTTVMRESIVGDDWIREMCRLNPVQRVIDEKTGQPNGNLLTGPVRMSFPNVFTAMPGMKNDPNSRKTFNTAALFTPFTNFAIFWEEYYKIAASDFANHYDAQAQQYYGLDNPFYDQGTKSTKYTGFTPGCLAMNTSSTFKPAVAMASNPNVPVIDEAKVYPGVWAILCVNSYASGKTTPRKGPRFGLQAVMLIGDDKNIGGGGQVDPRTAFRGVNVKPPMVVPTAAFGQAVQPPPPGGAPGQPYYPPGGHMPAPAYAPPPPASPPALGHPGDEDLSQFR